MIASSSGKKIFTSDKTLIESVINLKRRQYVEHPLKNPNYKVEIFPLSDAFKNEYSKLTKNLYANLFYTSLQEADSFLLMFHKMTNVLTSIQYPYLDPESNYAESHIRSSYVKCIQTIDNLEIGQSTYLPDNNTFTVRLRLDFYEIHGQLILISTPRMFYGYPARYIVETFFNSNSKYFTNPKLMKQIKLFNKLETTDYFCQLITSLLNYQPVLIKNQVHWFNFRLKKEKQRFETLKNESILEKL